MIDFCSIIKEKISEVIFIITFIFRHNFYYFIAIPKKGVCTISGGFNFGYFFYFF